MWTGRKGAFRPVQPLEPQPRGAVTRRGRSEAKEAQSALTPCLCGGYPLVLNPVDFYSQESSLLLLVLITTCLNYLSCV